MFMDGMMKLTTVSCKLSLMIITIFYSPTLGELKQVTSSKLLCPNDNVVFECANYANTDVNWIITSPLDHTFTISLSSEYSSVNHVRTGYLESSPLKIEVTFANTTSIVATLTLGSAINLNGTAIMCNGEIATLLLDHINSKVLPTLIVLTKLGETYNYLVSWTLQASNRIVDHYNITITPPPHHGLSSIVINDTSFTLRLTNDTSHILTLTTAFCNSLTFSQDFIVAGEVVVMASDSSKPSTENTTLIAPINVEYGQQCIPIIAGVSGGSFVLTIIISIITFILGLMCGTNSRRSKNLNKPPEALVYEEIKPVNKPNEFEFTSNAAYGETRKL